MDGRQHERVHALDGIRNRGFDALARMRPLRDGLGGDPSFRAPMGVALDPIKISVLTESVASRKTKECGLRDEAAATPETAI